MVVLCFETGVKNKKASSRLLKIIEGTAYRVNRSPNEREVLS